MNHKVNFLISALLLHATAAAVWQCESDAECSSLAGGTCDGGVCACPRGQQAVAGGTECVPAAPYFWSPCVESSQCGHLITGFTCGETEGGNVCRCLDGFHYFSGRCWPTREFGESCVLSQECISSPLRDPYALACVSGTCACADNYYLRQRGECRRIGTGVGDECVLNADCQFPNGACDFWDLTCYDTSAPETRVSRNTSVTPASSGGIDASSRLDAATRQLQATCDQDEDCGTFLRCSSQGHCVCPVGYYSLNGVACLAELGSPVTAEAACGGVFSVARDVCRCPANFIYQHHMRDCFKASVRFSDACAIDENCLTFGAAGVCGEPAEWGLRECDCQAELAVRDLDLQMCRLYSPLGETCEVESDCLAGELQVLCVPDSEGVGRCTCPPGLEEEDGLCLTRGLGLGDECQVSAECDGARHAECAGGVCACEDAYLQQGDTCWPAIDGVCSADEDCIVANTGCVGSEEESSCQCQDTFVEYNRTCLTVVHEFGASCEARAQCLAALGDGSDCVDGQCTCLTTHHFRNQNCWPITGLYEACAATSQCYLGQNSERVVCRNDLCQCDFDFPYSSEANTCVDSGSSHIGVQISLVAACLLAAINLLT